MAYVSVVDLRQFSMFYLSVWHITREMRNYLKHWLAESSFSLNFAGPEQGSSADRKKRVVHSCVLWSKMLFFPWWIWFMVRHRLLLKPGNLLSQMYQTQSQVWQNNLNSRFTTVAFVRAWRVFVSRWNLFSCQGHGWVACSEETFFIFSLSHAVS